MLASFASFVSHPTLFRAHLVKPPSLIAFASECDPPIPSLPCLRSALASAQPTRVPLDMGLEMTLPDFLQLATPEHTHRAMSSSGL